MRTWVDKASCNGCGNCVEICPNVFQMNKEFAEVKEPLVPGEDEEECRHAADNCPTSAIKIQGT